MNPIPYGRQSILQPDIDAVVEVLKSDYLTQGPIVKKFEEAFASYVGSRYAVAVANGTAALHLNALALGVQPGDQVITSPITFAASANCIRYAGGEVVFADIDPDTYLLDINAVRALLEKDQQKRIKGIIPVDFAGRPVDIEAFRQLADEFGCWIIEDACHAPGASFYNSHGEHVKVGDGKYADLTIFSFHPVKHIAAGEGGMITTNNAELYEKLMQLRTHGITRDSTIFQNELSVAFGTTTEEEQYPNWYMEMQHLGYNYRLSDINCALGLSQLERAVAGLLKRQDIARTYYKAFQGIHQVVDQNAESASDDEKLRENHGHHLYVIEVENRFGLYQYLREHKIFAQIHYIPCHLMPYYQKLGAKPGDHPKAEAYYSKCISLPMYPTLTEEEQQFVIDKIKEFYNV